MTLALLVGLRGIPSGGDENRSDVDSGVDDHRPVPRVAQCRASGRAVRWMWIATRRGRAGETASSEVAWPRRHAREILVVTPTRSVPRSRPVSRGGQRELVLCVPRSTIFPDGAWHGLVTTGLERVLRTIRATAQYLPRALVEDDASQQQVIPYCVVRHADGTYLVTRRLRQSSERRLHHLYSLGVGGHINPGDGAGGDAVVGGLSREWREEIVCPSPARARLVAVLNDDGTPVSRVHLGLVFLVEPQAGRATVRETEKLEGEALTPEAMRRHYLNMESWSQLVYEGLVEGRVPGVPAGDVGVDGDGRAARGSSAVGVDDGGDWALGGEPGDARQRASPLVVDLPPVP